MNATVKACGWASGSAKIFQISLGNPIICGFVSCPAASPRQRLPWTTARS
jgi:hypothetical protein